MCIIFSTRNQRETLGILDYFLSRKILPQAAIDGNVEIWDQWVRNKNCCLFCATWKWINWNCWCWGLLCNSDKNQDNGSEMQCERRRSPFRFVCIELQQRLHSEMLLKVILVLWSNWDGHTFGSMCTLKSQMGCILCQLMQFTCHACIFILPPSRLQY